MLFRSFHCEQLRKYRPVSGIRVPPEGFLNYSEAGALLGVKTAVIRGLVAHGILEGHESRNGFAKLVPAGDFQRFAEKHVAAPVLARVLKLDFRSLPRFLRQAGAPVLAIPVIGKGQTVFVRQEVATGLIDSCRRDIRTIESDLVTASNISLNSREPDAGVRRRSSAGISRGPGTLAGCRLVSSTIQSENFSLTNFTYAATAS